MSALEVEAEEAVCLALEDSIQVGWQLPDSALKYLLLALPLEKVGPADAFFGHSHYVEVQDQVHGRYGGLEHLAVLDEQRILLRLKQPVAGMGAELVVRTKAPLEPEALAQLRRAEVLVGGDDA